MHSWKIYFSLTVVSSVYQFCWHKQIKLNDISFFLVPVYEKLWYCRSLCILYKATSLQINSIYIPLPYNQPEWVLNLIPKMFIKSLIRNIISVYLWFFKKNPLFSNWFSLSCCLKKALNYYWIFFKNLTSTAKVKERRGKSFHILEIIGSLKRAGVKSKIWVNLIP